MFKFDKAGKFILIQRNRLLCLIMIVYLSHENIYSQKQKIENSLLWEISGKEMLKPSYLYGTMHVSNKVAYHFKDSFFIALSNVDNVALEMNPELWLEEMMESSTYNNLNKLSSLYRTNYNDFYSKATIAALRGDRKHSLDFWAKAFAEDPEAIRGRIKNKILGSILKRIQINDQNELLGLIGEDV